MKETTQARFEREKQEHKNKCCKYYHCSEYKESATSFCCNGCAWDNESYLDSQS